MNKTMLTGLKPTGSLTLGNYIGSIKQMIDNQQAHKHIQRILKESC